MKKKSKSLQEIEDFYIRLGYRGNKLREALSKDKEHKKLLDKNNRFWSGICKKHKS